MPSPPKNPTDAAANNSVCTACGAAFRCGALGKDAKCWCFDLPHVVALPPRAGGAAPDLTQDPSCLCPACLAGAIAKPTTEGT